MSRLSDHEIKTLADKMLKDYDEVNPGTIFAKKFDLKVSDAWRLQTAVAKIRENRGEKIIGYKIGCVSEITQKNLGLTHPAWGRLWLNEQHNDGATLHKKDFANVAIEAEFAVFIDSNIDPGKTSIKNILGSIASVHPVIEIHNFVMRGKHPNGS